MKKMFGFLKNYLFYARLLALATLVSAFIPALNPLVDYGSSESNMLFTIFADLGQLEQNLSSILATFNVYGDILYVTMLFFYVGWICYLCGLILSWSKEGYGGQKALFMGSLILMLVYIAEFSVYFSIRSELALFNANDPLLMAWMEIPPAIYYHFGLSFGVCIFVILGSGIDFKAVWYRMRLNWIHRFDGGVHPTSHKNTRAAAIEKLPPQKMMIFPLSQHIGAVCTPLVKIGDYVRVGQKIADTDAAVSAPIHSSVSGTVVKISEWDHPTGNRIPAIIVENDFEDNRAECFQEASSDYESKSPEELIHLIREAGIVGMGGAGFPTHIKLSSALGRVDTVVINAAECEPYLSSDHREILENVDELLGGLRIVRHIMGAHRMYIGIENNKPDAISLLHKRLVKSRIKVVILKTKYPQGGEKQLIRAVTGRVVPSGKLPADVGCLVLNVDTIIAIYRAIIYGEPLIRRTITVAGHGVARVGNVSARIGTPFSAVLDYFGYLPTTKKLIMGGPMMGIAQYSLDAPVIKSTSALLCFTRDQLTMDRDVSCIRCGSCVSACPMNLVPNYIAQYVKTENFEKVRALHAADCIECGCCSFTCPAKIPLIQYMRIGKQKVQEMNRNSGGKRS